MNKEIIQQLLIFTPNNNMAVQLPAFLDRGWIVKFIGTGNTVGWAIVEKLYDKGE